jgi:hypothetical protein
MISVSRCLVERARLGLCVPPGTFPAARGARARGDRGRGSVRDERKAEGGTELWLDWSGRGAVTACESVPRWSLLRYGSVRRQLHKARSHDLRTAIVATGGLVNAAGDHDLKVARGSL